MFDFAVQKTVLIIAHVLGGVVGATGAYVVGAVFLLRAENERAAKMESRFMKIGSVMAWAGLMALILTGIALAALDPAKHLSSPAFLAKATITGVILLNGLVFHALRLSRLFRSPGSGLAMPAETVRLRPHFLACGAISAVSWAAAILLGVLSRVPYSYGTIMIVYAGCMTLAVFCAFGLQSVMLPLPSASRKILKTPA